VSNNKVARIRPAETVQGEIRPPGDKSISHRALILGALAKGVTSVEGFLPGNDCLSTMKCLQQLGANINNPAPEKVIITGNGFSLKEPDQILDAGNSGTTARLLTGVLAGLPGFSVITGDASLRGRPMLRVVEPLRQMGAQIWGRNGGNNLPLAIKGQSLKPICYRMPVASAQVKSALLLAGLFACGRTEVREPVPTRDHTERMLAYMGAEISREKGCVFLNGGSNLTGKPVRVPADFSAAAFFLVAASLLPESRLTLKQVGVNPGRTGLLEVLQEMGADISLENRMDWNGEPVADIKVRGTGKLKPVRVGGDIIPRMIDEIPVLAVAAAAAAGETVIKDAAELKVKESNRLETIAGQLVLMGASVEVTDDGMVIRGGRRLHGASLSSCGDHRIAMALAVAALAAAGETVIEDFDAVAISYPSFIKDLLSVSKTVSVKFQ